MKCPACIVTVVDAQVSLNFRALSGGQEWHEFPVIAGICPKCGKMELHCATPQQLTSWLGSEKR